MNPDLAIAATPHEANMETKWTGHKVVAMPPVESLKKHHHPTHTPTRSLGKQKQRGIPRPKSPARMPASRSRDIVQEVYDRMGVNFVRGRSSIELDDSKSVISIHSGTKSVTKSPSRRRSERSRSSTESMVGQLRASSTGGAEGSNQQKNAYVDEESGRFVASQGNAGARWSPRGSVDQLKAETATEKQHPVVVLPTTPRQREGDVHNHIRSYSSFHNRSQYVSNKSRDERNEHRDDDDVRGGRQSPVSVKSRISAFSGYGGAKSVASANARNGLSRNFAQSPTTNGRLRPSRVCPPSRDGNFTTRQQGILQPPPNIEPVTSHNLFHQTVTILEDRTDRDANMSTISMDESHGLGHTSHSRVISDSLSRVNQKGGIANSFLASIASSRKLQGGPNGLDERRDASHKRVPVEIRPVQHTDVDDDHSIAASSVSGEDFAGVSKSGTPCRKLRPSGSVSSFAQRYEASTINSRNNPSSGLTLTTARRLFEKLLEAKFAAMNETMGAEIRRLEEQTITRLDEFEKKIDAMLKQASIDATDQQTQLTAPLTKVAPATMPGYYRSHAM